MKIGIIDADLIGRPKHRFPNLVCEKLSGYWKEQGAEVSLKLDYDNLDSYDHVYIAKVFTDTPVPEGLADIPNVTIGGTGFFFDKAPNLPYEIEHHMPDYSLYDGYIKDNTSAYTDYSIGFLTRGCFRKCPFCVNQKYNHVFDASPLEEFLDTSKKKICLLDDNFLGHPKWRQKLEQLNNTGKRFRFKQGLDERLLTDESCSLLFNSNYDGEFIFAFDSIKDYDLVHRKLELIKKYRQNKRVKFYVLTGFEGTDVLDIENTLKRIKLLMQYECLPYVMKYRGATEVPFEHSIYRGLYVYLACWCNQPHIFKRMSFREYCWGKQAELKNQDKTCSALKALKFFEAKHPVLAAQYFDLKFGEVI